MSLTDFFESNRGDLYRSSWDDVLGTTRSTQNGVLEKTAESIIAPTVKVQPVHVQKVDINPNLQGAKELAQSQKGAAAAAKEDNTRTLNALEEARREFAGAALAAEKHVDGQAFKPVVSSGGEGGLLVDAIGAGTYGANAGGLGLEDLAHAAYEMATTTEEAQATVDDMMIAASQNQNSDSIIQDVNPYAELGLRVSHDHEELLHQRGEGVTGELVTSNFGDASTTSSEFSDVHELHAANAHADLVQAEAEDSEIAADQFGASYQLVSGSLTDPINGTYATIAAPVDPEIPALLQANIEYKGGVGTSIDAEPDAAFKAAVTYTT